MNNIEKISSLDKTKLLSDNYLQSLMEEAFSLQLLSDKEIEKVQLDCLSVLAVQTERYNKGESSSIRTELAQSILTSVMFTVGVYLKSLPSPDAALAFILSDGIEAAFENGTAQITRKIKKAKILHSTILSKLIDTPNIYYTSTIDDGIRGFFRVYTPDFSAHEIHITADYPVYNHMEKLLGIEFIESYLQHIYYENMFCHNFFAEDINNLLRGYNKNYEGIPFNIYEIVLAATMGCVLTNLDAFSLRLSESEISSLYTVFSSKTTTQIATILANAFSKLQELIAFPDGLISYINESLLLLSASVESALKLHTLDKVFVISKHDAAVETLSISFNDKMNNALYCKLLEEFMDCNSLDTRIKILNESIHSLVDLVDILLDSELTHSELYSLLKALSPAQIAALMHKYKFQNEMGFDELRDSEKLLCECLKELFAALTEKQKAWINKAIDIIND